MLLLVIRSSLRQRSLALAVASISSLLLVAASPPAATSKDSLRIFYLGNSFTSGAGGQPNLVAELLAARGIESFHEQFTAGGETLSGHLATNRGELPAWREQRLRKIAIDDDADAAEREASVRAQRKAWSAKRGDLDRAFISGAPWDVVVVQPGRGIVEPELYGLNDAASQFARTVRGHDADARIVLFAGWADPRDGARQPEVDATARRIAEASGMLLAPVGRAMHAASASRPELEIFVSAGDFHPGRDGAYLIACVLYSAITGESPLGLPAVLATRYKVRNPDNRKKPKVVNYWLSASVAAFLQQVAWEAFSASDDPARAGSASSATTGESEGANSAADFAVE